MDIKKLMASINEAQNAADRVRPFISMVQAMNDVWQGLKDINPDELQALVNSKAQLQAEVDSLTARQKQLAVDTGKLSGDFSNQRAALQADFDKRKADLESQHAQRVSELSAELKSLQDSFNAKQQDQANQLSALAQQKAAIETEIQAFKDKFAKASSAIHG